MDSLKLLAEYNPGQKGLIKDYAKAFKKLHANKEYVEAWVDKIMKKKFSPAKFIKALDRLVIFEEGTIVKHKSGWGMGKVISMNSEKMEMIVNLEKRPNHRMDALAATDCLRPVAKDSFNAMIVFQPEKLQKEAEANPIKLIARLLKYTEEPMSAKEIKLHLHPKVIDEKTWSKWWAKTRKKCSLIHILMLVLEHIQNIVYGKVL